MLRNDCVYEITVSGFLALDYRRHANDIDSAVCIVFILPICQVKQFKHI